MGIEREGFYKDLIEKNYKAESESLKMNLIAYKMSRINNKYS